MRSPRPRVFVAACVLPVLFAASACGGGSSKAKAAPPSPSTPTVAPSALSASPSPSASPSASAAKLLTSDQLTAALLTEKEIPGGGFTLQPNDDSPNPTLGNKACEPVMNADAGGPGITVVQVSFSDSDTQTDMGEELIQFSTLDDAKARMAALEDALGTCKSTTVTFPDGTTASGTYSRGDTAPFGDDAVLVESAGGLSGQPPTSSVALMVREGSTLLSVGIDLSTQSAPFAPPAALVNAALAKYTKAAS